MPQRVAEQLREVYDLIDELESVGTRLRAKADAASEALRGGEAREQAESPDPGRHTATST